MATENSVSDSNGVKAVVMRSSTASETAMPAVNPTTRAQLIEATPGGTITTGQVATATANTAVRLTATSTTIKEVMVRAFAANTTPVYIGTSTVTTATGQELTAGMGILIKTNQLNALYMNSATVGNKVSFLATN